MRGAARQGSQDLRGNVQSALNRSALRLNLLLEESDRVDQLLGTRRASGNIDIDGNNLVHTLHQRVVIEDPA